MLGGDREDSKLYLTTFILWGVEPLYMTLLVIQGRGGMMAPREQKRAISKILVNQRRNEPPCGIGWPTTWHSPKAPKSRCSASWLSAPQGQWCEEIGALYGCENLIASPCKASI
jgi:hypothetical protein